jgi:hypothetical protein
MRFWSAVSFAMFSFKRKAGRMAFAEEEKLDSAPTQSSFARPPVVLGDRERQECMPNIGEW